MSLKSSLFSSRSATAGLKSWTRIGLRLSAILCMMILWGCSCSKPGASLPIPSTPTLTSQKIVVLDGVRGWWIDERDAATLAQWIYDIEQAAGR